MTLSKGFRHDSVKPSEQILTEMGKKSGAFQVTVTQDVGAFTRANLKNYQAVMFYTTGELPFTEEEKAALVDFLKSGHGFVGVHSATDTLYDWPVYLQIVGAYFEGHPWHQMVTVDVVDPKSPLVGFLGKSFEINDEIYQLRDFQAGTSQVLLKLDTESVNMHARGVTQRSYGWPLAWTRGFGEGRVFYTALGHEEATWKDPRFQEMLTKAIKWAMREGD